MNDDEQSVQETPRPVKRPRKVAEPAEKKGKDVPSQPTTPAPPDEGDGSDDDNDDIVFLKVSEDRQAVKQLLDTFDDQQLHRYEAFRRAHFPKQAMRKMCQGILGVGVPSSIGIIVAGVSKVFVGEMTELALSVMEERGETGPILPSHLREAYRRTKHKLPSRKCKRKLF